VDVGTIGGKSFERGYCNLLDKTGLAADVKGDHREIYQQVAHPRRDTNLNFAFCFALFLGHAVITQGQAEDYYFYEGPNGELVISNKQPLQEAKS
jgi:hypothetical protein